MKILTKIFLTIVLALVAIFSDGTLAIPAFAALLYIWGISPTK